MKKKRKNEFVGNFIRVSALLLLLYMSASGSYINGGLFSDSEIFLFGLIDLLVMSFILMIVPFIWRILNKQKFSCEKGKKICKWNSIIVFVVSLILSISTGYGIIGGLGAVFYYYINKWLFVDETKSETAQNIKNKKSSQHKTNDDIKYICSNCNNHVKDDDSYCPHCGESFIDNEIIDKELKSINENITRNEVKIKKKTTYCKNCGGKLNDDKKCTKCGKQYFHIKSKSILILIPVSVFLIISVIINVKLYNENAILYEDYLDLHFENKRLEEENEEIHSNLFSVIGTNSVYYTQKKLEFFDEHIVFVIEGYGNKYYTYDCVQDITNGERYNYWAYNTEAAKSQGYKKGTC